MVSYGEIEFNFQFTHGEIEFNSQFTHEFLPKITYKNWISIGYDFKRQTM
jgi:hypothetical protein